MRRRRRDWALLVSLLVLTAGSLTACATAEPVPAPAGKPATGTLAPEDAWSSTYEDPAWIVGLGTSQRLADLVGAQDVSPAGGPPRILGMAAESAPYPDSEWHFYQGGIDRVWNGTEPSALEKYMTVADPSHVGQAQAWNHAHHGPGLPSVTRWSGLCNGWSGAAVAQAGLPPMTHDVSAWLGASGHMETCAPGSPGCVTFALGDIHGLLAEIYSDTDSAFLGGRCDRSILTFDAYGRVDRVANRNPGQAFGGCQGLNPASLVTVLAHRVRDEGKPVVIDVQDWSLTNSIWNRPAWGYVVHRLEPLDEDQAVAWVVGNSRPDPSAGYLWNTAAHGFALLDLSLLYVRDLEREGPQTTYRAGRDTSEAMRLVMVLELDRPAVDPLAQVLGGEYVVDPQVPGSARLTVPPFLWVPTAPPLEDTWSYPWWISAPHNPYLRSSLVLELAALARSP